MNFCERSWRSCFGVSSFIRRWQWQNGMRGGPGIRVASCLSLAGEPRVGNVFVASCSCLTGELKPKPKRQGRAESFLSYRWTLGPPTVLLPCKYTLSSVNEECYLLVHPSQWLIFQRNFQIGQLFKEGQQKVPKRLFRTWWPGVVFRALALGC